MADVVPISEKLRGAREEVLRRYLDANNSGDMDGIVAVFHHPRIELVAGGRVFDGADAVREHLEARRRSFPDQRFELIRLHHSDSAVITEHWTTSTHLGNLQGVEATGKQFKTRMAAVYEFDDDRLVCARYYYDTGSIARQLA